MSKLICIDPGHGGYDPGVVAGARESDFNLTVALDLKAELEKAGCRVIMTRTADAALGPNEKDDLQKRCTISDNAGADLFLAIHANAGGGNGAEAYCLSGGQGQIMAMDLLECLKSVMGYHGSNPIKDGSDLYVVKHTAAPAVLLEVGFMDSSDFKVLAANLHRFGALLAPPIIKFLGGNGTVTSDKDKGLSMIRDGLRLLGG